MKMVCPVVVRRNSILRMLADTVDLYADANPIQNGLAQTGPASVHLHPGDTLSGIGKIIDMEFGIASTDQGLRTYPQLVAISGGTRQSTFNVFRRGIPINKRRRFNELATADRVWFLPIQRLGNQGPILRGVRDEDRTTVLLSSEGTQTRVSPATARQAQAGSTQTAALRPEASRPLTQIGVCALTQGEPRADRTAANSYD
jgi:hypothetical protein